VAPTTTAVAARTGGVRLSGADADESGTKWQASVLVTVKDDLGRGIAGATVSAKLRYDQRSGNSNNYQWQEQVVTLTSGADGTITWSSDWYKVSGSSCVLAVQFVIEGAQLPGNLTWDQSRPSVTVNSPG
jgi:hypothetical protein